MLEILEEGYRKEAGVIQLLRRPQFENHPDHDVLVNVGARKSAAIRRTLVDVRNRVVGRDRLY